MCGNSVEIQVGSTGRPLPGAGGATDRGSLQGASLAVACRSSQAVLQSEGRSAEAPEKMNNELNEFIE